MKLLLRRDIHRLGLCGDIVDVSEGYARNYLLPHSLALRPTKTNLKAIEVDKKLAAEDRARRLAALKETAQRLAGASVTISAACTPDGHLYGSVGPREISHALIEEGHAVTADQIKMSHNIKEVGTLEVPVVLADDLEATVKVWVVAEKRAGELLEEESHKDVTDAGHAESAGADGAGNAGSQEN